MDVNARDTLWTSFVATRNSSSSSGQAVGELVVGHRAKGSEVERERASYYYFCCHTIKKRAESEAAESANASGGHRTRRCRPRVAIPRPSRPGPGLRSDCALLSTTAPCPSRACASATKSLESLLRYCLTDPGTPSARASVMLPLGLSLLVYFCRCRF
jgi:hypothetical protein